MIYEMSCTFCHGRKGRGDGGAAIFLGPYSHPRPNDLTAATFKFRSTRSGEPPMLSDLMRTIREASPASCRPTATSARTVFARSRRISRRRSSRSRCRRIRLSSLPTIPAPARAPPTVCGAAGNYTSNSAAPPVTGPTAGKRPPQLHDRRGLMVMPMDLTRPDMFGNGRDSPEDIYRTLMTGLDGTPMPAYAEVFSGKKHELWDLVHFLMSLQRQ
jgi:hypothetical protein